MSRCFLASVLVIVAFVLGVFVEHNFKVINHVQYSCPYLNVQKCPCSDCDCCKACPGQGSQGKCECEDCDCCKKCPGNKQGKGKCCK